MSIFSRNKRPVEATDRAKVALGIRGEPEAISAVAAALAEGGAAMSAPPMPAEPFEAIKVQPIQEEGFYPGAPTPARIVANPEAHLAFALRAAGKMEELESSLVEEIERKNVEYAAWVDARADAYRAELTQKKTEFEDEIAELARRCASARKLYLFYETAPEFLDPNYTDAEQDAEPVPAPVAVGVNLDIKPGPLSAERVKTLITGDGKRRVRARRNTTEEKSND